MLFLIGVGVLLFSGSCLANSPSITEIEGCNETPNRNKTKFDRFNVSDFEFNSAKSLEVFRLRVVFKGEQPTIGISHNNNDFMFASNKESFAMYPTFDDFLKETNPSVTRGNSKAFNSTKFTPMEVVLTKGLLYYVF